MRHVYGRVSMSDFFISYCSADQRWAEWIAWQLEDAGYKTIVQGWDFRPGTNFALEMDRAASSARRTIAVISPSYISGLHTRAEWAAAFAQDPTGEKGTLLPVRISECELVGLLRQIVYVDLVGLDESTAKQAILNGIREERFKPAAVPRFPGLTSSAPTRPRFPGSLPAIWNLPHRRNPDFIGRESILADLRLRLAMESGAARFQAITGLGGIGKTQLAIEYAYRHAADYTVIWWVRGEEPTTLGSDYAALTVALAIPEKDTVDQLVQIGAARRWLGQNCDWLLVFDNVRDSSELLQYLPQSGTGHVLATSRNPNWRGVAQTFSLPLLLRTESVALLLKRTNEGDEGTAATLAETLGDLPLALEQAGAYVDATRTTLGEYLTLFSSRRRELWPEEHAPSGYSDTVDTTWNIAFDRMRAEHPSAEDLLNLCAFLAPNDIPRTLLINEARHLPGSLSMAASDPLTMNRTVQAIVRYSLMQVVDDALSVHPLVQTVTRDRLGEAATRTWIEAAVLLLHAGFPSESDKLPAWPECSRLLPHAMTAAKHADAFGIAPAATAVLLGRVGRYLKERGEFAPAQKTLMRALEIDEAGHGPNTPEVATDLVVLGDIMEELGDSTVARAYCERALAIDEANAGVNHDAVSRDLLVLGSVSLSLGDFRRSRAHLERALEFAESASPSSDPTIARILCKLGDLFYELRDLAASRASYERALAIDEATYGHAHPTVALDLSGLGNVCLQLGDAAGARSYQERALAITETADGPSHPRIALYLNNLAVTHLELRGREEAGRYYERARVIAETAYGTKHPLVVAILTGLGYIRLQQRDFAGARTHYERARTIAEESRGPNDALAAQISGSLGHIDWASGDLRGAAAEFRRALATLGETHWSSGVWRRALRSAVVCRFAASALAILAVVLSTKLAVAAVLNRPHSTGDATNAALAGGLAVSLIFVPRLPPLRLFISGTRYRVRRTLIRLPYAVLIGALVGVVIALPGSPLSIALLLTWGLLRPSWLSLSRLSVGVALIGIVHVLLPTQLSSLSEAVVASGLSAAALWLTGRQWVRMPA